MPQATAPQTQTEAERQVERAKQLERERHALMQKIDDNRKYLRLMDKNEALSDEQGAWLDDFYPLKEKNSQRSKEEIERTRKVKEEARKVS